MIYDEKGLDQFWLPPEWYPHEATWLSWLHNKETWPFHILKSALPKYLEFIYHLSKDEKVRINTDLSHQDLILEYLLKEGVNMANVELFIHPTNDSWCRDHGPDFLLKKNGSKKLVLDWIYNCWGEKYPPFDLDNKIPHKIAESLGVGKVNIPMVLEGGSFDVNGEGVLLTTKSCLLNKNRNPLLTKDQIEANLKKYLCQNEVIWLEEGVIGDDTDGHIDDISRFVSARNILTCVTSKKDENYYSLHRNKRFLECNYTNRFEIVELPLPEKMIIDNVVVPASYANFYIANNKVIVPIFGDVNDQEALNIINDCFPEREVIGIDSSKIIYGLGSFHCLSKQEPQLI